MVNLTGKDLISLESYNEEEIWSILNRAIVFKTKKQKHTAHDYLRRKNIALIFEKDSIIARSAFEVAANDLGINTTFFRLKHIQIGKRGSISDTAKILSKMYDGIAFRSDKDDVLEELAKSSSVPVWNGKTFKYHPTQVFSDLLTAYENFGYLKGLNWAFVGDATSAVANSLMIACAKLGINYTIIGPREYYPDHEFILKCEKYAKASGSKIEFSEDLNNSIKGKQIIYTTSWTSSNDRDLTEKIGLLKPYQINSDVVKNADPKYIFLHNLSYIEDGDTSFGSEICKRLNLKELEVTDEVFNSSNSKVIDQAENRMHTIKALLYLTIKK